MLVLFDVAYVDKVAAAFLARIFFSSAIFVNGMATADQQESVGQGNSLRNTVGKIGAFVVAYLVGGNISHPLVGVIMLMDALVSAMGSMGRPETLGVNVGHRTKR